MATSRIAICLFKKGINQLDQNILLGKRKLTEVNITEDTPEDKLLVVRETENNIPGWFAIVEGFSELESKDVVSSSSGAILFFKYKRRIIGCCFGTSIAYINRENTVSDFGLGAAFEEIRNENTKSIESFTLNSNPLTINRVTTNPTQRHNYEIDRQSENITELSGFHYRDNKRILIKGKEFYSTPCPIAINEIIQVGKVAFNNYNKAIKDNAFKSLTSSKLVKDKEVIAELENELCNRINARNDEITLCDYEYFPNISEYRFKNDGASYEQVSIDDFYDIINTNNVTIQYLKNKKLIPYEAGGTALTTWSIFKSLFAQLVFGNDVYILFKSKWYQIDQTYLKGLKQEIEDCEIDLTGVTPWDGAQEEQIINQQLANELNGQFWDRKLYRNHPDFRHGIEFSDVLTTDRIIHVKKYKGSSLTSHLLNQTSVSAILLRNDQGMRDWISDRSTQDFGGANLILDATNSLVNDNIEYLILFMYDGDKKPSEFLPFFSMVALQIAIKRIRQLGFEVKVSKV